MDIHSDWPKRKRVVLLCALNLLSLAALAVLLNAGRPRASRAAGEDLFSLYWSSEYSSPTSSLAWGDYDNDGDLDLAVGNAIPECPTYPYCLCLHANDLYENKNGTLVQVKSQLGCSLRLGLPPETRTLAWGDVDGDGDLDLAIGVYIGRTGLYLNNSGDLDSEYDWRISEARKTTSLAWGDVDGDGDLDLALGNSKQEIQVYRNDGAILEDSPAWESAETDETNSLAWADYDGDGDLDLAAGNKEQGIRVYQNDSAGGVIAMTLAWTAVEKDPVRSLAWGDYDGDGDPDLAAGISCHYVGLVWVCDIPDRLYRNDGGALVNSGWTPADNDDTRTIGWGDYDGDGDLDLMAANQDEPSRLYRNNGGNLETTAAWQSLSESSTGLAWGDFDNDGDLDLALGNDGLESRNRLFRNESGRLASGPDWQSEPDDRASSLAWGDYDSDGDLDLAVGLRRACLLLTGCDHDEPNRLYRNDGGVLVMSDDWLPAERNNSSSLAWGDYDGDGDLDLAVGNGLGQEGTTRVEGEPNYVYENQAGTLVLAWTSVEQDPTTSLAWGDYDGDGDLDLAVGNGHEIKKPAGTPEYIANRLYRNDGGNLTTSAIWSSGAQAHTSSLAWGDFDNDGDLDLAAGTWFKEKVFRNDAGSLSEAPVWSSEEPDVTFAIAWGDYDGDGDLDLASGNSGPLRLYRNDGGNLSSAATWSSSGGDNTSSLAWGDFDGDGDLDLAAGNEGQPNRLYCNLSGMLDTHPCWSTGAAEDSTSIAWGDYDGDGDLDLAAGNDGQPGRLYRNNREMRPLPGSIPGLSVLRPPANADFYSSPSLATGNSIPLSFSLYNPQGEATRGVTATYSLDGGGQWSPALAASPLTGLPAGIQETFDPIAYDQWHSLDGAAITTTLCGGHSGAGLNFNGSSTRAATTRPLDASGGGTLRFALRLGTAAYPQPCELVDAGEGVRLEYSTNGGASWTAIQTYLPGSYDAFTVVNEAIPVAARTATTQFRWRQLAHSAGTGYDHWALDNVQIQLPQVFQWDILSSGFLGQSDNVVVRLQATPALMNRPGAIAGPFQYGSFASQTFPFRARGRQVRVMHAGQGVEGALVFRQPAGDPESRFQPYQDANQLPYRTSTLGWLPGYGTLNTGDRLVALVPVTETQRYSLYTTNAIPDAQGLEAYTVTAGGVQTVTVSTLHRLLLFNLDIALEWDARNDGLFLEELDTAIQNASAILFDVSDGQMALGEVRLHMDRQDWTSADVVFYAQSGIRPRATMGGVVDDLTDDVDHLGNPISSAYGPGQIRIGPNWDPFGANLAELTPDWQRALAHELSHYLLFLPDNYIGVGPGGEPVLTDCRGSFMTNTYDDDYSEFLTSSNWTGDCLDTIAQHTTGRADWQTITKFWPAVLSPTAANNGPSSLPLLVTHVSVVDPGAAAETLPPRYFDVRAAAGGALLPLPRAQAFLFQTHGNSDLADDQLLPLGPTVSGGDRFKLRGALPGDRLCLFASPDPVSGQSYSGCLESLSALDASIPVAPLSGWQPAIQAQAVTSTTLLVTATLSVPLSAAPFLQVFPTYGAPGSPLPPVAPAAQMLPAGTNRYVLAVPLTDPAFEGWLRLFVPGSNPPREALSQFFLSPPWGPNRGDVSDANQRAWGANARLLGAPAASGDGQVTIFNLLDFFADTGTVSLQALNDLPDLPPYLSLVGQAYRFSAGLDAPRAIAFSYLQREAPPGYEHTLNLYYSPNEATWQRLQTRLDTEHNMASAQMPSANLGQGLYALVATLEMPALSAGWNLFSYPVPEPRPVAEALASISGAYSAIYHRDATGWLLFDPAIPGAYPGYAAQVNTLAQLDFGLAYWLYATRAITPYLGIPSPTAPLDPGVLELPPATFFGQLLPGTGFTPAAGLQVTASVGDVLCGQATTQEMGSIFIYVIQVSANGPDHTGCGEPGESISFQVAGQSWQATAGWDNTHASKLDLAPPGESKVFLPVMVKP